MVYVGRKWSERQTADKVVGAEASAGAVMEVNGRGAGEQLSALTNDEARWGSESPLAQSRRLRQESATRMNDRSTLPAREYAGKGQTTLGGRSNSPLLVRRDRPLDLFVVCLCV